MLENGWSGHIYDHPAWLRCLRGLQVMASKKYGYFLGSAIITISRSYWIKRTDQKYFCDLIYPSVQCAAVRICWPSINDPPQKLRPSIKRAAIHGYENGGGGAPPTIFPWTCSKYLLLDFHREGSVVLASDSTSPGNGSVVDSVVDVDASGSLSSKNERPQIP